MIKKLSLTILNFNGSEIRCVDHPEKGELMMAKDVLAVCGYAATDTGGNVTRLNYLKVPTEDRLLISRSTVENRNHSFPNKGATFLTRDGVRRVLMASTKPAAKEFQAALADERSPALKLANSA